MKKSLILLTLILALTLLVSCGLTTTSTTEGLTDPTIEPVVVDNVNQTNSDTTDQDPADSPTSAPTAMPIPPTPTQIPAEDPAAGDDADVTNPPQEDYTGYWSQVQDERTGLRFAVPCFWIVNLPTPEQDPTGLGAFSIHNFTQEWVDSFGPKAQSLAWENGGVKIDMGFPKYETWNLAPNASLDELVAAMHPADDDPANSELISAEPVRVNFHDGLLLTLFNKEFEQTWSYYLFPLAPEYAFSFGAYPPAALQHPDILDILFSIAFSADVEVQIPIRVPAAPPEGIEAPCLKGFYEERDLGDLTGTLACPAENGAEALACSLQDALLARDTAALSDLMADPFAIGYWRSEGVSRTAAEAVAELDQYHLPADTSSLTFTADRAKFPLLMGMPPEQMFGPDVNVAQIIYSEGWGQDGLDAALLYLAQQAEGSYVWHGMVLGPKKFDQAQTEEPTAAEDDVFNWQVSLSNEEWIAEAHAIFPPEGGNYYRELVVHKVDDSVSWTLVQEEELWALGYSLPVPMHFSQDGRYLYFTHSVTPDGCGLFAWNSNLQQVELATGQISEIERTAGISLAISPDDTTLALVERNAETTTLVLRNLLSGEAREIPLNDGEALQAGRIVWSSDGSSLVLTIAHDPCGANWTHSIIKIEADTLSQTTLVDRDARHFWPTQWTDNTIRLEDVQDNVWSLDAQSGQISAD